MTRSVEAGLDKKILRDVLSTIKEDGFLYAYWTLPSNLGIEPLFLTHVLPSMLICIVGLALSTIVFVLEILFHKLNLRSYRGKGIKN